MSIIKQNKNYFYDYLDEYLRILVYEFENYSSNNYRNVLNEFDYYYNHLLESFRNNMQHEHSRSLNITNKFFMKEIIKINSDNLRHGSLKLRSNLNLIISALQNNGNSLKYVPYSLKENENNYYLNIMAINNNPDAIKYSCYRTRCDKNLVLSCLYNSFSPKDIYNNLPFHLKEDMQIIKIILNYYGNYYLNLPFKIKKKRKVILTALRNPLMYSHIPKGFQNDKGIINLVLKKDYKIISNFSDQLINDNEILKKAIDISIFSINHFSKRDDEINKKIISKALERINKNVNYYKKFPNSVKKMKEVIFAAIDKKVDILNFTNDEIKNNKEIIMYAINKDIKAYKYASESLKNDNDIFNLVQNKVFKKINKSLSNIKILPDEIKNNNYIIFNIIMKYKNALKYFSKEMQDDVFIVSTSVNKNPNSLQYASSNLQNNKNIVLTAVKKYGNAYKFASNDLKNDKEIVLTSFRNSKNFLHYYSEENKNYIKNNIV